MGKEKVSHFHFCEADGIGSSTVNLKYHDGSVLLESNAVEGLQSQLGGMGRIYYILSVFDNVNSPRGGFYYIGQISVGIPNDKATVFQYRKKGAGSNLCGLTDIPFHNQVSTGLSYGKGFRYSGFCNEIVGVDGKEYRLTGCGGKVCGLSRWGFLAPLRGISKGLSTCRGASSFVIAGIGDLCGNGSVGSNGHHMAFDSLSATVVQD